MNEALRKHEPDSPADEYIAEIVPYLERRNVCNAATLCFINQFGDYSRLRDSIYMAHMQNWVINTERFKRLREVEQQLIMETLTAMFELSMKYIPPMGDKKKRLLSKEDPC